MIIPGIRAVVVARVITDVVARLTVMFARLSRGSIIQAFLGLFCGRSRAHHAGGLAQSGQPLGMGRCGSRRAMPRTRVRAMIVVPLMTGAIAAAVATAARPRTTP